MLYHCLIFKNKNTSKVEGWFPYFGFLKLSDESKLDKEHIDVLRGTHVILESASKDILPEDRKRLAQQLKEFIYLYEVFGKELPPSSSAAKERWTCEKLEGLSGHEFINLVEFDTDSEEMKSLSPALNWDCVRSQSLSYILFPYGSGK